MLVMKEKKILQGHFGSYIPDDTWDIVSAEYAELVTKINKFPKFKIITENARLSTMTLKVITFLGTQRNLKTNGKWGH